METPSAIKLGSSGLVQGNIDRITVNGNEESLLSMYGQSFDPSNKAEMDQLAFYLKRDFHLNMNGTSISVDHGGAVHDIVTQLQGEKASGGAVFEKLNTHVDQMGSYTNGTNFPDKNELMLYTYKGQPDRMILDISHMGISTGIGLNPPEVNIAQLAANPTPTMSAGFYFSFQNPAQGGIFVPVGANGTLTLDPHDTTHFFTSDSGARVSYGDLSRMLVDKDALAAAGDTPMDGGKVDIATELSGQRSVWNVDKIQAVVRRTDGGTTILNSVATITGMPHGKMPAEITYWTEGKADPTSFTPIHTTTTYDLSTSQNTTVFNLSYQGEEGYLEEVIVPLNYTDMARDNRDEGTRGNYTKIPVGWVENNNRAPAPAPIAGANRGGPAAGGIERVDVDGLNITKDRFTEWLSKLNENFSDDLLQNWLKAEYLQNIDPAQVDAKLALIMADTVFTDARAQWLKEWSTSRTNALVNAITAAPLAIFSPDTIKELNRIKSEMNDKIQDIETNGITNATQAAIALYLDNERGQKLLSITKESDGKFKIKYQNLFGNSVQQEADYTVSQLIPMLLRDKVKEDIIEKIYHVPPSATTTILGANWFPKVGELRQKYNDTIASMKDPAHSNEHFSFIKEDTYLPIARSSEVAGRLYINPYNDHVPEVAEAVIQKLKEYNRANPTEPLEIQMKLLTPEKLYPEVTGMKPLNDDQLYRPDKMVLYFKEQDVEQIFQIMREVHSEFEKGANKIFSTRTPLLTAQLKDENGNPLNGMAFAEQPRKRMGRDTAYSGEVAYALYNLVADAQGDIDEVYVKQNIGKYLDNANIDPEHPGLLATRSEFTGVARDFIVNNTLSSIAQGVAPYAAAA
ncbi:hypothetical protein HGB07_00185 [Candidatus Roizmanbacteria bacterium]|nr:hypothetical protein [Candidatus Roizmanbacteria bacterium]